MKQYIEILKQYRYGLITKDEANKAIDFLNMGSGTRFYSYVREFNK